MKLAAHDQRRRVSGQGGSGRAWGFTADFVLLRLFGNRAFASMKTGRDISRLIFGASLLWALAAPAQTAFQNLGFESASFLGPPPDPVYGRYYASNAIPGWSAYVGATPDNLVLYNNLFLDSAGIAVIDANAPLGLSSARILGTFTLGLEGGIPIPFGGPGSASIAQMGFVPSDTRSLRFFAQGTPDSFGVSLGGENLPLVPLSSGANYTIYGADLTGFAGQMAELRFTAFPRSVVWLDGITFAPTPVPEPTEVLLVAFGLAAVALVKWSNKTGRTGASNPSARSE